MAPAPRSPNWSFLRPFLICEFDNRIVDHARNEIDVLLFVILVPGQYQDVFQGLIRARKPPLAIFHRFGTGQAERKTAVTKGFPFAEDLAVEGRFLNVERSAEDPSVFQSLSQSLTSTGHLLFIHAEAILPIRVD